MSWLGGRVGWPVTQDSNQTRPISRRTTSANPRATTLADGAYFILHTRQAYLLVAVVPRVVDARCTSGLYLANMGDFTC